LGEVAVSEYQYYEFVAVDRPLDVDAVERYLLDEHVAAWSTGKHLVLDLTSEDEESDWDRDAESWLPAILGVRAELAAGDLRPLYLAWLAGYGSWERDEWAFDRDHDDESEPPVPPGLSTLTAAQRALAEFLRLDEGCRDSQARPPAS
jgi:hypothetical protein